MIPEIYQEIEAVTDRETARKIAELFQGCQVYFPMWNKMDSSRKRDAAIYRDRMSGMGVMELALKYGLTERRIRMLVDEKRPKQGRLPI
ncbi:MAG: Mor transcription activator family protein [Kiritimatiellia bacterium]